MKSTDKRALRIFLQFAALIILMAVVNLYLYFQEGNIISLFVAVLSGAALAGWSFYYARYIKSKE